jgi:drug/metabolite transporter (DMT)-like permease
VIGPAQLAAAMAITGVNVPVGKWLADSLPVTAVVFLRCVIAIVLLVPLARILEPDVPRPRGGLLANLVAQAATGTVLYNLALLWGLRRASAIDAGLVLASMPAVMAVGAFLFLAECPSRAQWLAAGLAALGIAALHAAAPAAGGEGTLAGTLAVFVAVCGEAAYALLARRSAAAIGPWTATLWMQLASAAMLAPLALPALATVPAEAATPALGGGLVFHAATASVLHLVLWYAGLRHVPAARAGVFAIFLPAAAAATAIIGFGEPATLSHAVGFALMVLSVLLAARR